MEPKLVENATLATVDIDASAVLALEDGGDLGKRVRLFDRRDNAGLGEPGVRRQGLEEFDRLLEVGNGLGLRVVVS